MKRGKFIVLEGIDGCGKTTVAKLLAPKLKAWSTKEPTTTSGAGKKIKAILEHKKAAPPILELQKLYMADRALHTKKIEAVLGAGKNVVCQRYAMSTFAYGMAFGIPHKDLKHKFLEPDMTFLLDLPAEIAMKRIKSRKQGLEYFEKQEKLKKIRAQYKKLAKQFGATIIDARLTPEVIAKKILAIL